MKITIQTILTAFVFGLFLQAAPAFALTDYASEVMSAAQGLTKDGGAVLPERSNTASVLGASDGTFYSLGFGGQIVVKLPQFVGKNLSITPLEITNGAYPYEYADVYVSVTGESGSWVKVGTANNQGGAGNNPHGTPIQLGDQFCIQYVKVVDVTDPELHANNADGFDIDAIGADFSEPCPGQIIIEKQTNPADSDQSFDFDPSWSENNFSLKDNEYINSGDLLPGEYSVTELSTPGWTISGVSCTSTFGDEETVDAIHLNAGETVTCTFTNTMDETPPPPPTTDPCEVDHSCACGPVTVVTHNNATVSNTVITKSSTGKNTATGGTAGKGGNGGNGGMFGGQGGNGGTGGAGGTGGGVSTGGAVSVSTIHNIVNNVLVRIRR